MTCPGLGWVLGGSSQVPDMSWEGPGKILGGSRSSPEIVSMGPSLVQSGSLSRPGQVLSGSRASLGLIPIKSQTDPSQVSGRFQSSPE
jgi:hypothetical protein